MINYKNENGNSHWSMKYHIENCAINDIKQFTYTLNYFVIYLRYGLENKYIEKWGSGEPWQQHAIGQDKTNFIVGALTHYRLQIFLIF